MLSFPGETKLPMRQLDDSRVYLRAAQGVLQSGVTQVQRSMMRFQLQALGLVVLLYGLYCTDMAYSNPQPIPFLVDLFKVVLVVLIAALVWLSVVVKRGEMQGLLATKLDLDNLLSEKTKGE